MGPRADPFGNGVGREGQREGRCGRHGSWRLLQVRKLEGAPAATCKGWLQAAEERLLLEQILSVAKAESAIAMAALS